MFALLRDGKQVGDSFSSKASEKQSSVDLKFELEGEQDKLCKSSFKLDVQVKCGKKLLKREVSVTKRVHDAILCTSSASEEEDEGTLEDVNEMFDLRNIHMEGNTFYYTQQVYNVKGNMVQGETINLPADLLASMGINQTNFVMDEDGNYRYKAPNNLSTTDRKVLKERLRKEVKRELETEYGERVEVERRPSRSKKGDKSNKPTSPEEQRRLNRLQLEKDKLQMKREKDERDAALALEKEQRVREERLAKREDDRYRDKLRMDQKQMEQQQQMAKAMLDAQRRQSGDKGGTPGADKAMMEQMMKMMRESKKGDVQPIIQEVKGEKKSKDEKAAPAQPQVVMKEKPTKKKSKKVKKLEKQYKKMLKMLKEQQKLAKKPKSKKQKVSREVREMIIHKYREQRSRRGSRRRSRHGSRRRSRDGIRRQKSRHRRKGSKSKGKYEPKKHKHKKSHHGSRPKKQKNQTKKGKVANPPENKNKK